MASVLSLIVRTSTGVYYQPMPVLRLFLENKKIQYFYENIIFPKQLYGFALMTENRIRHLLLVENDGVGGVISIGAAVKAIIFEQECMIEQLEHDASM